MISDVSGNTKRDVSVDHHKIPYLYLYLNIYVYVHIQKVHIDLERKRARERERERKIGRDRERERERESAICIQYGRERERERERERDRDTHTHTEPAGLVPIRSMALRSPLLMVAHVTFNAAAVRSIVDSELMNIGEALSVRSNRVDQHSSQATRSTK